jgi:hypothetical protein
MESTEDPFLQQGAITKAANEEPIEYATGCPTRYLPGVTIVGQPAIEIRRGKRAKPPGFPSLSGRSWDQVQPFGSQTWQNSPADPLNIQHEDELPLTLSIPQGKDIPSLDQMPALTDIQPRSGSLLAHIANQICNGS